MRLFWLILALLCNHASATLVAIPELRQQVTDLSGTLNPAQIRALTQQTQQLVPAQVAILVVPTTGEDTIEQYATRVFDKWKLGDKTRSDGVLLLVAWQDHTVRIEVGYGLEGTLTDAQSGKIIRTAILPAFRQNNLALGLQRGITHIGPLVSHTQPAQGEPSVTDSHLQPRVTPDAQAQTDSSRRALNTEPEPLIEQYRFRYTLHGQESSAARTTRAQQTTSTSHGSLRSEPLFQYGTGLLVFLPFFLFRRNHVVLRFLKRVATIAVICGVWLLIFPAEIVSNNAIFFFIITSLALLYWRLRKNRRHYHSGSSSSYSSDGGSSYSSDSGSSYSRDSDSFSCDGGSSGGCGASDSW